MSFRLDFGLQGLQTTKITPKISRVIYFITICFWCCVKVFWSCLHLCLEEMHELAKTYRIIMEKKIYFV